MCHYRGPRSSSFDAIVNSDESIPPHIHQVPQDHNFCPGYFYLAWVIHLVFVHVVRWIPA